MALPASGSYRVAFDSSIDLMPLPSPWQLPVQQKYHMLAACLQALHTADNPSTGASDSAVVGTGSELVLVTAEWEMLASGATVAYETEAQLET